VLRVAFALTLLVNLALVDPLPLAEALKIAALSTSERAARNLEQDEIRYQEAVHEQTMADLVQIYSPENLSRIQIAYASFTPESAKSPGEDRGFGLHIVKRLEMPQPGGGTRTIYVNEQWPEDKRSKGLLLPDEIRIRTQVASGARRVRGSERLYAFDSVRVAWGPHNREAVLARRTIYRRGGTANQLKATRTGVSAPLSCAVCHQSENRLANAFLRRGETRNYEAIVQDSQFELPPDQMRGFRQYIAYLEASGASQATIQSVSMKLSRPEIASLVPGFGEVVSSASKKGSVLWVADDTPVPPQDVEYVKGYQGVYRDRAGKWWTDAIQDVIEGKYVWWEPESVIP
jgi:hypothetical protein